MTFVVVEPVIRGRAYIPSSTKATSIIPATTHPLADESLAGGTPFEPGLLMIVAMRERVS
jgi:hypothetical protein